MVLVTDVQRCRRMVSGMRVLVLASSVRQQLLQELLKVLNERAQRPQRKELLTPRARYQQRHRAQRVCLIQRQWRRFHWHRLIMEKTLMERRWRERRGNKRFVASAIAIQRVFRGYRVRKQRYRDQDRTALQIIAAVQLHNTLEIFRTDRIAYHARLIGRMSSLEQARANLRQTAQDKLLTEAKITAASKKAAHGSIFIDAKLLDGTVVRMEAHQLLFHQTSEIDRLNQTITTLERKVIELQETDPVVRVAAKRIQDRYRVYRCQQRKNILLRRQRHKFMQLIVSRERCYDRMNAGLQQRQLQRWQHYATVVTSLYHILQAKKLRKHYREQRAISKINNLVYLRRLRHEAQGTLRWYKTKHRAKLFRRHRQQLLMEAVWRVWMHYALRERQRKAVIAKLLQDGQTRWVTRHAVRLQRFLRRVLRQRMELTEHILPTLHPYLVQTIHSVLVKARERNECDRQTLFRSFYQQITQELHAWRVPSSHLYYLARRYRLCLDSLTIDGIWAWLQHQQETISSGWALDLQPPYTTRSLEFLAQLSRYWDRHDRIQWQMEQLPPVYEAERVVRAYLMVLYAHNDVCYATSTTYSSQQRQRAIEILQQCDEKELVPTSETLLGRHEAFTAFHSVRTDLCEQCFTLQMTQEETHKCSVCGHRRYEQSTLCQPRHAAKLRSESEMPLQSENTRIQWVADHERCDFLVLNAYFHALAPPGHVHRELYNAQTLWQVAMAKAFEPLTKMYNEIGITSLNDLLNSVELEQGDLLVDILPNQVIQKLTGFVHLFKAELLNVHKKLQRTGK